MSTGFYLEYFSNMDSDLFNALKKLDGLRVLRAGDKKVYLHNEHRWVLPIIFEAQNSGTLPHPCNLIMFDRHHDFKDISDNSKTHIKDIVSKTVTHDAILDLCSKKLCPTNGDWIMAGMELGLIQDALTIGAESLRDPDSSKYTDQVGRIHHLRQISDPVSALAYQGELADVACGNKYEKVRNILGWEQLPKGKFQFSTDYNPIWLDFDLDCFSVNWGGYYFPWPKKVWKGKITIESTYSTTKGMTGDWFIKQLINRAGLITIAREPKFCGSEEESDQILERVNHYLFDDSIEL